MLPLLPFIVCGLLVFSSIQQPFLLFKATGATEADKAELGLELRLESIIVVDPLSLPLYEIR
jgi:hypothetical protein